MCNWVEEKREMDEGEVSRQERGGHGDVTPEANPGHSSRDNGRVSSCVIGLLGRPSHF